MTDRYADLITNLEAAPEGSRELDIEIAYAAGWKHKAIEECGGLKNVDRPREGMAGTWHKPGDRFRTFDDSDNKDRWPLDPPLFSTSLDAALTLVPQNFGWGIDDHTRPIRNADGLLIDSSAHICRLTTRGTRQKAATHKWPIIVHAPTPALALCIAALKARAAEEG